jgi:hypothetical protein
LYDLSELYYFILRIAFSGQPDSFGHLVYSSVHDSIMPSKELTSKLAPDARHVHSLKEACLNSSGPKLSKPIDKNSVIAEYDASCVKRGIKDIVSTAKKGEPTTIPITYPTIAQLVRDCPMKPSLNHQYRVSDLRLDNVIVKLIKSPESFLTIEDVSNLS